MSRVQLEERCLRCGEEWTGDIVASWEAEKHLRSFVRQARPDTHACETGGTGVLALVGWRDVDEASRRAADGRAGR